MRQLTYLDTRRLEWRDVPEPKLASDSAAIVEPLIVSTCGMDGVVIHGALRIRRPTPVGHEGVGRVVDAGDDVTTVAPGDLVLLPWKIACGTCRLCARGHTAQCEAVAPEAAYGWHRDPIWGGFFSDLVHVPYADAMLKGLPPDADAAALAGLEDNVTDGWRAVGPGLAARPGGTVLVGARRVRCDGRWFRRSFDVRGGPGADRTSGHLHVHIGGRLRVRADTDRHA